MSGYNSNDRNHANNESNGQFRLHIKDNKDTDSQAPSDANNEQEDKSSLTDEPSNKLEGYTDVTNESKDHQKKKKRKKTKEQDVKVEVMNYIDDNKKKGGTGDTFSLNDSRSKENGNCDFANNAKDLTKNQDDDGNTSPPSEDNEELESNALTNKPNDMHAKENGNTEVKEA